MAAIRLSLQRNVFDPLDERLLAVCHVNKLDKKKDTSFLCVIASKTSTQNVSVCQLKKNDKGVYKKKRTWTLADIKQLDGKSTDSDTHEFDLHCDKIYKWLASSPQERQLFFSTLWKHYLRLPPKQRCQFKNISESWLTTTDDVLSSPELISSPIGFENDNAEEGNYQAISDREEAILTKLIEGCNFALSDAEKFMEVLSKDLCVLDSQNVQIILASEQKVEHLMKKLSDAEREATQLEDTLDAWDETLCRVREAMRSVKERNSLIATMDENNIKIMNELGNLNSQLDIPLQHQKALEDPDLTSDEGLEAAIAAGKALRAAMNCSIQPPLLRLSAVLEQRKRFERWHAKFSKTISRHLNNMFIHLGNDMGEIMRTSGSSDLIMPQHNAVHQGLLRYTELMHWMKVMDNKAYIALRKVYENSLGKLYERDLKNFFEEARHLVSGSRRLSGSREDLVNPVSRLRLSNSYRSMQDGPLLGSERDQWPQELDPNERQRCDGVLEQVFAELEPVCLREQQFCVAFFQLDVLSPGVKNTETTLYDTIKDTSSTSNADSDSMTTSSSSFSIPQKKIDKQINEDVRKMMSELFACLETELNNFISYYEKLDNFYCMNVFVRLSKHVMSAQDTGSFLSMSFATVLVQVKRNFDEFMKCQKASIENVKVTKKSKCGILPYVHNFEDFAKTTETIFKNVRRPDIEKWYVQLVGKMFEMIPIHAAEHSKTPQEVIKMENFHHLYDVLSRLKISVLDALRKEAKIKYTEALKAYVTQYFGRPLEKLNIFFDGVQAKMQQGVKESEIGYQLAFSKQELRKVIQQYHAKEVKKGLDNLFKKVEKHLSEEENLLQVVWRAMQEEFIQQYKNLEELIQLCYPGSMIALDFTIDDILEFFSDIALSH